jgi:hypothetical protein
MGFVLLIFLAMIIAIVIDNASITMHLSPCNAYKPPSETLFTSHDLTVCSSTRSANYPAIAAVAVPPPLPPPAVDVAIAVAVVMPSPL